MRRFLTFRDFDWTLLAAVLLLCALSVLEIYSATLHTKYVGFHTKQMLYIAGGLAAMFVFAKIDYHRMLDLVPWFYGVFMLLLVATKLFGHKALGGRRWIKIGPMLFQPSEWVKLILILAVARYFANLGGRSLTWRDIFKALAMVGAPMVLVLIQPDLGTSADLHTNSDCRALFGRHQRAPGANFIRLRNYADCRCLVQWQDAQAIPERPAHQLHQPR
jgi:rod shape determining protein RodA